MKDRKFHINKELKDNYPNPGVPPEEAWAELNKMLGPVPPNLPPAKGPIKGIPKFMWHLTSVVTVVIVTVVTFHSINNEKKNAATVSTINNIPGKKDAHNEAVRQDTLASNDKIENPVDKSITVNDSTSQINTNTNTEDKADNKSLEKDEASLLHNDSAGSALKKNTAGEKSFANTSSLDSTKAILQKNKMDMTMANTASHRNTHSDPVLKNKLGNKEKNNSKSAPDKNITGNLSTDRHHNGNHTGNRNRIITQARNNEAYDKQHNPTSVLNHRNPFITNRQQAVVINTPKSSLPARTISFIKEPISTDTSMDLQVDSSFANRIKNALKNSGPKKHRAKSKSEKLNSHKKSSSDPEYGFQWDVPIPIQGTTNYFTGTNGKSKPYNILIPQLWLSKSVTDKSKIFFKFNVNQQYFTGNKKLAADTAAPPLDSTYHKTILLKTSGYSATLQYSYRIYKNWAAAVGVTYSLNRNALLNKQEISTYRGVIESDTIYGIKRSSIDWKYIKNSQLSGNIELYYMFKKFNIGASLYLPLSNIPVYGNKNVHPVNAQIFLRWNIKKE